MFGLVLNALRARRAQTVALFALTVLAAVGASAAPWYLSWARDSVAIADVRAAPPLQRLVIAGGAVRYAAGGPSPTGLLRDTVQQHLDLPGATTVIGARLFATMTKAGVADAPTSGLYLNSRDEVCAQIRLVEGACPTADGDVMVGRSTAESLQLRPGDELRFEGFRFPQPVTLRVSGTYEVQNQLSPYWAGADLLATAGVVGTVVDEPAYVSEQTLLAAGPTGLDLDLHLYLPEDAFHGGDRDLIGTLDRAGLELRQANLELKTLAGDLIEQIDRDQRLVTLGVTVASSQMVLLCWFVLFLAVRHTSDERRPDIGLLKLRGAARWRIWMLTALQSATPMLVGAALGWGIGFLAAGGLSGDLGAVANTADTTLAATLWLSVVAAAVACLGALLAAVLAESGVLRSSVVVLLRRVPGGRRGWRAEIGDLVIVALAVAGVYQGYAELKASGEPSLLALLAPALVGLGVALLVARALPWLAGQAGAAALRSGRPGAGLTALHLARRPGTHRVFAVLAVCVAVFTTAMFFWHTATVGWADRAAQQLGAREVLTVQAPNSTALVDAVRAVDPDGGFAMAVARTEGSRAENRLLAVDSSRLATLAIEPDQFSGSDPGSSAVDRLVRLLRPPMNPAPLVRDGPITVEVRGPVESVDGRPVGLRLQLMSAGGTLSTVEFGSLDAVRRGYPATVDACPGAGCRLVAVEPLLRIEEATPAQSEIEIYGITQAGREVVTGEMLADISRWSGQLSPVGVGNTLSARDGHLTITPYTGGLAPGQRRDFRVFALAAPAPLPLLLAGARPPAQRPGDERFTIMGTDRVAYQVVAQTPVLPRLGATGGLVDLEYAQRSVTRSAEAAVLEVWLNEAAPADAVARLEAAGVRVLERETVGDVADRLADQGPGVALRFQLFAAGIVLLLGAGTVVVTATVERRSRVEELTALRNQGLSDRSMVVAGHGGTGVLVAAAILTGLIAAIAAQAVVTASMPIFADNWSLLPLHRGAQPWPLLLSAGIALLVLGAAAITGSARVVAAVRARPERDHPAGRWRSAIRSTLRGAAS